MSDLPSIRLAIAEAATQRKTIDTVVIHHTSNPPGLRRKRLSAIELVHLYGPYFIEPRSKQDAYLKGRPRPPWQTGLLAVPLNRAS